MRYIKRSLTHCILVTLIISLFGCGHSSFSSISIPIKHCVISTRPIHHVMLTQHLSILSFSFSNFPVLTFHVAILIRLLSIAPAGTGVSLPHECPNWRIVHLQDTSLQHEPVIYGPQSVHGK